MEEENAKKYFEDIEVKVRDILGKTTREEINTLTDGN